MIEIETKFKLSTGVNREQLLEKLAPKFSASLTEKHQIDTVFLFAEQVDVPIAPGSKIMRVRDVLDPKSGELTKSLLTLKVERQTKLASDEHECAVEDGVIARQMLAAMGWQEVVTVDKLRAESKIGEYNICIDEVARLGLFIELEVLAEDDSDVAKIQTEMEEFLRGLGLKGEIWTIPYDTNIRNLRG